MSSVRLFVASVYAPSPWNREWYNLQRKFLQKNTPGIDMRFGVLLNGISRSEFEGDVDVLFDFGANTGHSAGMAKLLEIMRASDYTHYLLLDSDCFPVHNKWFHVLTSQMHRFGKRFAAPIRAENLDVFPHPCAFFCDASAISDPEINFDIGHEGKNVLGEVVRDVGNGMLPLLSEILPLMRSNMVNRHPIAAGVYHHLFYHHGAGSRNFEFRIINKYQYCEHWWKNEGSDDLATMLREELFANPEDFLSKLMCAE